MDLFDWLFLLYALKVILRFTILSLILFHAREYSYWKNATNKILAQISSAKYFDKHPIWILFVLSISLSILQNNQADLVVGVAKSYFVGAFIIELIHFLIKKNIIKKHLFN